MSIVLDARDLVRIYHSRQGLFARPMPIRAVDGVSLTIRPGETLGIVGESGSGKSTLGRMLLGIDPAQGGEVRFDGAPLPPQKTPAWRALRARIQMVYQYLKNLETPSQRIIIFLKDDDKSRDHASG